MGRDAGRFRWSRVPFWVQALGALLLVGSFYLFFITFRENTFLSPAVRVQRERAHTVIRTGPYRHVRHPMYAGFVLFVIGTAFLLVCWYGLVGGFLLVGLVARRAVLEERVLRQELDGYAASMTQVKYRFIPYVC